MNIIQAATDPTSSDKSPAINVQNGDLWLNTATDELFLCLNAGTGAWSEIAIAGSSVAFGVDGIDVNPGSDIDTDIATVGVTGAPKLWWDESLDSFALSKPLFISGSTPRSTDPAVCVNRTVDDTGAGTGVNGHCYSDSSLISRTGAIGYNSFDGAILVSGSANYNHFAVFQNASNIGTSGTTTSLYGLFDAPTVSGGGVVTNRYGVYVAGVTLAAGGTVTNNYGIYIAALTAVTATYDIYSAGAGMTILGAGAASGGMSMNPAQGASGDLAAGVSIKTGTGSLGLVPSGDVGEGDKVQICAWGNSAFKSVFETANKAGAALPDANLVLGGGNVGVGTSTYGTTASKVLALFTGAAPTTSPADTVQIYSADAAGAGTAALHVRTEAGNTIKLYQQAHIADFAGDGSTAVNAILVALENVGLLAAA